MLVFPIYLITIVINFYFALLFVLYCLSTIVLSLFGFLEFVFCFLSLSLSLHPHKLWLVICMPVVFVLWLPVRSDVVHSLFGDDTNVDVVAWAEVVHDACLNSSSHQLLRRLQLREDRSQNETGAKRDDIKQKNTEAFILHTLSSFPFGNRNNHLIRCLINLEKV